MNDAYYNQGTDMLNLMGDLQTDQLEAQYRREVTELARQYAESKMQDGWNRGDTISISIFYQYFTDYLFDNYILKR